MSEIERGLETLVVWQRSLAFAVRICKLVLPLFPPEEKWVLESQLRRSAQSIPANIAEGYGRYYYQDSVRFCYIARGSLEETYTHITLAQQLGYLSKDVYIPLCTELQELRRLLNGYINFLKQSKRGKDEPGDQPSLHESPDPYDGESNYDPFTSRDSSLPDYRIT